MFKAFTNKRFFYYLELGYAALVVTLMFAVHWYGTAIVYTIGAIFELHMAGMVRKNAQ